MFRPAENYGTGRRQNNFADAIRQFLTKKPDALIAFDVRQLVPADEVKQSSSGHQLEASRRSLLLVAVRVMVSLAVDFSFALADFCFS
jgi:hypothetical protein